VVSFSLALPRRISRTRNQTTALRYSLMKTMSLSRSGIGFRVSYDECHMRIARVCFVGLIAAASAAATPIDAVWWRRMAVIGSVNDYRHQSWARRRPIVARLPVDFFDANWRQMLLLGLFMIIVLALPGRPNGLITSGSRQPLNAWRSSLRMQRVPPTTTAMNELLCSESEALKRGLCERRRCWATESKPRRCSNPIDSLTESCHWWI